MGISMGMSKPANKWLSVSTCLSALLALTLAAGVNADANRVNSKDSIKACKAHLLQQHAEGVTIKFKNKSATAVDNNKYTHRLNAVQIHADGRESLKVLCETTRSGSVVTLDVQSGRWKF